MSNRNASSKDYKYKFQNQEKDDNIKGKQFEISKKQLDKTTKELYEVMDDNKKNNDVKEKQEEKSDKDNCKIESKS